MVDVARHEAGHAVVALALGARVPLVSVRARKCIHQLPERSWSLAGGGLDLDDELTPALRLATVAAAGVLAVNPDATLADFGRLGGSNDCRHTNAEGIELARHLVRELAPEIERLAAALDASPDGLSHDEIVTIVYEKAPDR